MIIASAFELPGAIRVAVAVEMPDVQVRRSITLPAALKQASAQGPNWSVAGEQILLSVPGIARFLVTAGQDIAVEVESGLQEGDVAVFLQGSVLAILLHQRQQMALRASAISLGGKAILFCGPPGAGKSTLAAVMSDRGYAFFNDDLCRVNVHDSREPVITPDGTTLKLWGDAVDRLAQNSRQRVALRHGIQKFHVEPRCIDRQSSLPIRAVYMIRDDHPALKPGIALLPVGEAAMLLRRNSFSSHLAARTGPEKLFFDQAMTLQRRVKLYSLTRRMSFEAMPQVVDWLESHWRSLGLIEEAA